MKIKRIETLINKGTFASWPSVRQSALDAVASCDWPAGSGTFTIYPESGKRRGEGNGVTPIKSNAIATLVQMPVEGGKWVPEYPWPVGERVRPGNMDAAFVMGDGLVCFEWETGNVSSSHRSMNKMCLGLLTGRLKAGLLVVPSRALYVYLTDRIGNIAELEPYFPLWAATPCNEGVLEIIVIEHDATSTDVPRIPKGTDGRALA